MKEQHGKFLRSLRLMRGWTQAELARRVHVSQPAVAQWEAGRTRPSEQTVKWLADAFELPMSVVRGE